MMTSKRSLIGVAALFAIAATGACGSDESAPNPATPMAGAPGSPAGAGGAPASVGGGATSAGAPSAGAPAAGAGGSLTAGAGGSLNAGAGGSVTGGAGGASGRAGGSTGGAGGAAAGAGGAPNTATFAKVTTLLVNSCAGAMCHSAASPQADLTTMAGLYAVLTTPLTDSAHCKMETLVTPNNAGASFLLKIIQGGSMCKNNNATENIPRMPDNCSTTGTNPRACLTADQIKLVSDWIAAGAPQQ